MVMGVDETNGPIAKKGQNVTFNVESFLAAGTMQTFFLAAAEAKKRCLNLTPTGNVNIRSEG